MSGRVILIVVALIAVGGGAVAWFVFSQLGLDHFAGGRQDQFRALYQRRCATHSSNFLCKVAHHSLRSIMGRNTCRTENGHAKIAASDGSEPREMVDYIPEPLNRASQNLERGSLV